MTATCDSLIQGTRIRATRLDECGAVVEGECAYVVSKGFVSVALSNNETNPTEISQVLADGTRCYYRQTRKLLNNVQATIEMCEVDPELFELMTGAPLVMDDEDVAHGFTSDSESYGIANVALEVWLNLARPNCGANGRRWGYYLMPWLINGVVGKPTIENGAVNFTINEAVTSEGNQWGVGPYDIQLDSSGDASPLFTAISDSTHDLLYKVNVAPPEPSCGCQELIIPS